MKKFNFDEFLWFIVLFFLDLWIIYLTMANKINFYVGNNLIRYVYIAIIMLSIMSIFQIKNIFTYKSNVSIKMKLIPILLALILALISIFNLKTFKHTELSKELIENREKVIDIKSFYEHEFDYNLGKNSESNLNSNKEEIIKVNEKNPMILEDIKINPKKYIGKKLEIHGFVCKESYLNSNQFIIGRIIITCCAADSKVVGIIGEYDKVNDLRENDNVKIEGRIGSSSIKDENNLTHNVPVIIVEDFEKEY